MYSELKHYGLELVGTLISITWFIYKDPNDKFSFFDTAILSLGMVCGINTLVISILASIIFSCYKILIYKNITRKELNALFVLFLFALLYYFNIKHLTSIQVSNYPHAYLDRGPIGYAHQLLYVVYHFLEKEGLVAFLSTLFLFVFIIRDAIPKRLIFFSILTGLTFLSLSMLNLYPVNFPRHITWAAAFFYALIFYSIHLSIGKQGLAKLAGFFVFAVVLFISTLNISFLWNEDFEKTPNNQAISFIRSLPPSNILLYSGGQPVIEYYSKFYPDLKKHSYFGKINVTSKKVTISKNNLINEKQKFEMNRHSPGAWTRMWALAIMQDDFKEPARILLDEVPRDKEFYIFASHYKINDKYSFHKTIVAGLNSALTDAGCNFEVVNQLKDDVSIYKAFCENNS
jgi:hypothetical protein